MIIISSDIRSPNAEIYNHAFNRTNVSSMLYDSNMLNVLFIMICSFLFISCVVLLIIAAKEWKNRSQFFGIIGSIVLFIIISKIFFLISVMNKIDALDTNKQKQIQNMDDTMNKITRAVHASAASVDKETLTKITNIPHASYDDNSIIYIHVDGMNIIDFINTVLEAYKYHTKKAEYNTHINVPKNFVDFVLFYVRFF